jgi:dihydrofolate reductase
MRKIIVLSFITLDGVMQAPGGPEEDTSGGFKYGGWTYPYFDDFLGKEMGIQMGINFDLLLGRKTYDIFAAYWPNADPKENPVAEPFNKAKKYVVSRTLEKADWINSIIIKDNVVEEIKKLKEGHGPEIQVHGSGNLIQTLLKNNLVDELKLKTYPITLGQGKRLFDNGTTAAGFELIESKISPSGVIIANYMRAGDVRTGTF